MVSLAILESVSALPRNDQVELFEFLGHVLESDEHVLAHVDKPTVMRRVAELKANPSMAVSFEEFTARFDDR